MYSHCYTLPRSFEVGALTHVVVSAVIKPVIQAQLRLVKLTDGSCDASDVPEAIDSETHTLLTHAA